ncbi:unnamed protein product [Bursaphelenchus xylophilus]|uniref:(pine wood nematode) hypothetical protein n=1 Tax=Bursaphelenchus xylophilus TaxID=6326 RepID=A0A1I7RJT4_BURXY|nr:unnamed protein product [Bursaphelenchus xylophilus]CAG9129055.1 unnamed protein product [Bursaphelenchus xylophilus]
MLFYFPNFLLLWSVKADDCTVEKFQAPYDDVNVSFSPLTMTAAAGYSSLTLAVEDETQKGVLNVGASNNTLTIHAGPCTAIIEVVIVHDGHKHITLVNTNYKPIYFNDPTFNIEFHDERININKYGQRNWDVPCDKVFLTSRSDSGNAFVKTLLLELIAEERDENVTMSFEDAHSLNSYQIMEDCGWEWTDIFEQFASPYFEVSLAAFGTLIGLIVGGAIMTGVYFWRMKVIRAKVVQIMHMEVECTLRPLQQNDISERSRAEFDRETEEMRIALKKARASLGFPLAEENQTLSAPNASAVTTVTSNTSAVTNLTANTTAATTVTNLTDK